MLLSPTDILGIPPDASLEVARKAFAAQAQTLSAITGVDSVATEKLRTLVEAYQAVKRRLTKGKLHDEIEAANPFHAALIEVCQNVLNTFENMEEYWIAVKGMRYYKDDQGVTPPEAFYLEEKIDPKQRAALIQIHTALLYPAVNILSDLDLVRDHAKRSGSIDDLTRDYFEKAHYETGNKGKSFRLYFGTIAKNMVKFIASIDPEIGPQGAQVTEDARYRNNPDIYFYYSIAVDMIARQRGVFSADIITRLELDLKPSTAHGNRLSLPAPLERPIASLDG